MEIVLGFIIAVAIGVTGVGAGVITAPVLILFMHVTPAHAVGTALAFSVAVKILVVPMQIYRKQVDYRVLGYLLAGGLPGVLAGSYILAKLNTKGSQGILYAALGSTVAIMAAANLYRVWLHPARSAVRDWSRWLPAIALPIGAKLDFRRPARAPLAPWRCCGSLRFRQRGWWERIYSLGSVCRWSAAGSN